MLSSVLRQQAEASVRRTFSHDRDFAAGQVHLVEGDWCWELRWGDNALFSRMCWCCLDWRDELDPSDGLCDTCEKADPPPPDPRTVRRDEVRIQLGGMYDEVSDETIDRFLAEYDRAAPRVVANRVGYLMRGPRV